MKTTSLLLVSFTAVSGLGVLSLPAAAECWMTCPPGSTATPSRTCQQTATAEAQPVASPEAQRPVAKADVTDESFPATASAKKKTARPPGVATKPPPIEPKATPAPVEEATVPTPVQAKAAPAMQPPPAEPVSPAAVPAQARPQTPPPTAAFQPAPVQGAAPSPAPIPGPIPGTATMRVIPE